MYQYDFSEENKEYLLHFLRIAKAGNNKYCNLTEHQLFTRFLPIVIFISSEYLITILF